MLKEIDRFRQIDGMIVPDQPTRLNNDIDSMLEDLDRDDPEEINTISKRVAAYNPTNQLSSRPSRESIRNMYAQVETYQLDSNM
jgi:hypothetical protein